MSDGSLEAKLIGDGNVSGAGLPLPDAFTAIAEHLLDYKYAGFATLNDVVAHAMRLKTDRILSIWFSWEDFTRALITKMAEAGIVAHKSGLNLEESGYYYLSPDFKPGERYVVLKNSDIGFTARDEATRLSIHYDSGLLQALKKVQSQWADANWRALRDVQNAIDSLETVVGSKPEEEIRGRRPRPATEVRPTGPELAQRRYGFNAVPDPRIRGAVFIDGLRACTKCRRSLPPEAYERNLYWQGSNNQNWFMRGSCDNCYDREQERRGHGPKGSPPARMGA